MKTSIKFVLFAFGAASLAAAMTASASAQVVGGSKCSQWRDQTKGTRQGQCLTVKTDTMQDKEGNLKRDAESARARQRLSAFLKKNPPTDISVYQEPPSRSRPGGSLHQIITGPGYRIIDQVVGSGKASWINTRPGSGGSGGKRSAN
jgi:opacity protein-like surface antigen